MLTILAFAAKYKYSKGNTMSLPYACMLLAGLVAGIVLFWKIPRLPMAKKHAEPYKISIIIPARNEKLNIGLLLNDLKEQTYSNLEIICVDDDSSDGTDRVIRQFDVTYIRVEDKPQNWTGKTYACQMGALAASGQLLLFMDADVRLMPTSIARLANQYGGASTVLSVQPFHAVSRFYEHFALFFNLVGVGANGVACPCSKKKAGLFGPLILLHRDCFFAINGFEKVRTSVIEDVALGQVLQAHGYACLLLVGDAGVSFRMYHSLRELLLGFLKNYSSGAAHTPLLLLALTFFWLTALTAAPILVVQALLVWSPALFFGGTLLYTLLVIQLQCIAPAIGSFKRGWILGYPLFLLVFHVVFLCSVYTKIFVKKVNWKGRAISLKK